MTVPVLINRGANSAGECKQRVAAALVKAGIDGKLELLGAEQLARRVKKFVAAGARLVIVGGGDGTISAAAGAAADSQTTLGILPMGTLNHLARDLDMPFDLDEAAAVIAAGKMRRIDVAELNGRVFVNNAAIGLYPMLTHRCCSSATTNIASRFREPAAGKGSTKAGFASLSSAERLFPASSPPPLAR